MASLTVINSGCQRRCLLFSDLSGQKRDFTGVKQVKSAQFIHQGIASRKRGYEGKKACAASLENGKNEEKGIESKIDIGESEIQEIQPIVRAKRGSVVQGSFVDLFGTWNDGFTAGNEFSNLEVQTGADCEGNTELDAESFMNASVATDTEESSESLDDWNISMENELSEEWKLREGIKVPSKDWEDEDINKRFKLRNGKEVLEERTFLVGVELKGSTKTHYKAHFSILESLEELSQLAETAGLLVVGSTHQRLEHPNPKTYIGAGKVAELKAAVESFRVETVVFDDELSPGQLRNLEKALGGEVRVCDRTALILDIFSQRAATKEASLQVELAQTEYQLPRLTRMWSHLERQAGGLVKGMGEKQKEVDKRILRTRISFLKKTLETVREHRSQYRQRRAATPIPVASLVGYTNAGKSTLLNRVMAMAGPGSGSGSPTAVLAEDKLFATLDPTTRRLQLPGGKECLFTDTVGFIQKLPTQLVAAFRATLEEIQDSSLLLHVVDISHPMVQEQIQAVDEVLDDIDARHVSVLTVWNKIDRVANPARLRRLAERRGDTVCISALSGEGMPEFFQAVEDKIKDLLVPVEAVIPYNQGELLNVIHRQGMVEYEEFLEEGTMIRAHVPLALSYQLLPLSSSSGGRAAVVFGGSGSKHLDPLRDFDLSRIPGTERIIEIDG